MAVGFFWLHTSGMAAGNKARGGAKLGIGSWIWNGRLPSWFALPIAWLDFILLLPPNIPVLGQRRMFHRRVLDNQML